MSEEFTWEKFAVLVFVEPRAFNVEELDAGQAGKGERINSELCDRLVGAGVWFVVENVHGAIANLHEVNVTGDGLAGAADDNAMLGFERLNVICGEPNRNFNRNRHAIVGEHEALKLRMALVVGADRGNDECGRFGCDVLLLNDDEPGGINE